jgi:PAS domain S-box-containing protein
MFSISKGKTGNKALEKSLHSQQRRFEKMFFEAPVSMCILKGKEHVFISANDQYYKLTGRENIIGKTVREVFPEVEGQGYFDWLDKVYQTGETFSSAETPLKLTLPNGEVKRAYLNFMYQPYTNSEEKTEGIFYFGVDVTEQVVAREKIEEREKQYEDLIQNLPAAVYTVDASGRIGLFNKAAVALWGRAPEVGEELWCGSSEVYLADGTPVSKDQSPIAIAVKGGRPVRGEEVILKRMDGEFRNIVPYPSPIFDGHGNITGGINVILDITKRKRAEEELKKLSLIVRKDSNAVIITDPEGRIEWGNEAFTRITEFEFDEVAGKRIGDILNGAKTDCSTQEFIMDRLRGSDTFECEIIKYTKSGRPIWLEVRGQPLLDSRGTMSHYFFIETDITERKNAFEKLSRSEHEIRQFAKQLNNVLEDERSRIAREIHDEFGQQLVGLKMLVSSLNNTAGITPQAKRILDEMMQGLENTSLSLQNFATELRPGILDTLGLIPSIEWLAQEFEHKTGIKCNLEIRVIDQLFEKTLSNAYFRICQEALTNIVKHAAACTVVIQVIQDQDQLSLTIADNGKGIVSEKLENPFSMGLLGMRERANLIGAQLHIESNTQKGTRVQIIGKISGT